VEGRGRSRRRFAPERVGVRRTPLRSVRSWTLSPGYRSGLTIARDVIVTSHAAFGTSPNATACSGADLGALADAEPTRSTSPIWALVQGDGVTTITEGSISPKVAQTHSR
jgi:hypothetical protein